MMGSTDNNGAALTMGGTGNDGAALTMGNTVAIKGSTDDGQH